jgi:hypothetical protein
MLSLAKARLEEMKPLVLPISGLSFVFAAGREAG